MPVSVNNNKIASAREGNLSLFCNASWSAGREMSKRTKVRWVWACTVGARGDKKRAIR